MKPEKLVWAKQMRHDPTSAEAALWEALRAKRLGGLKFRRQALILGWIVDFYCPSRALVVEVDGAGHDEKADNRRALAMAQIGLRTVRFANRDVLQNMEWVLYRIGQTAK